MAASRTQARRRARRGAVQALYQWQIGGSSGLDIRGEFREREGMENADWGFFDELVEGVINNVETLDAALSPHLDRGVSSLDPVERAILRLATREMTAHTEVPFKVVINEAVDLARTFGAEQSHRYVNGVLDSMARELRPHEVAKR